MGRPCNCYKSKIALASQFGGSVSVFKKATGGNFTYIEDDSPTAPLINDDEAIPGWCNRLEWSPDDRFLLNSNPSHETDRSVSRANGFTLYSRCRCCGKLKSVPSPLYPGGSGEVRDYFDAGFNGFEWSGDACGFSNGSQGYLFANDYGVIDDGIETVSGRSVNAVNSPSGWTNPAGMIGNTNGFASTSGGGGNLIAAAVGFNIPTLPSSYKIQAISLSLWRYSSVANTTKDLLVQLTKDGVNGVGSNYAASPYWPTTLAAMTYPSVGVPDLWGTTWSPADFNSPNFGFLFNVTTTSIAYAQDARFTVFYTVDGSQVYSVTSSGPTRIAVLPHSSGTIRCFSKDDFVIAPPGRFGLTTWSGFGAGETTYSGSFVYTFDGANFTPGTIDPITLPSNSTKGWNCRSARFAKDQIHCGFSLCEAGGAAPGAPDYFYTAQRSGTNLSNPTRLVFTSDSSGFGSIPRTAFGDIWAISPDGSLLAFAASNGHIDPDFIHVYSGGVLVAAFQASGTGNNERVFQLCFSDDGKQLAAAQWDSGVKPAGRVCIWDILGTTFTESSQPVPDGTSPPTWRTGVAFSHSYRAP